MSLEQLSDNIFPCILHWNQNHFVVLYNVSISHKNVVYHIADPSQGLFKCSKSDLEKHWISLNSQGKEKGIYMFFRPTSDFYKNGNPKSEKSTFKFLLKYIKEYRNCFYQILFGLILGCIIQLILPFLTKSIVDVGVSQKRIDLIYLILLGQLIFAISRAIADFVRRWLLLHISMRINLSLLSDFFIKLLKLPMSFFDTKHVGDLIQRRNDHSRVEKFLTTQILSVAFSMISFITLGIVLFTFNITIFLVFLLGSILYGAWIAIFLKKRKILDYKYFEQQAINDNKTYQFITSMQEIKLQDCERTRRWEWEDIQSDLFEVQMSNLKLKQPQYAGAILINELKNIIITIVAATSVIQGDMTIGMMLAIQYVIGQLNMPIEQLMQFFYLLQDVRISLERINEIHRMSTEEREESNLKDFLGEDRNIMIENIDFNYDKHSSTKILSNVTCFIPEKKVTAIVGASGSGKTTLIKLLLGYYPLSYGESPLKFAIRLIRLILFIPLMEASVMTVSIWLTPNLLALCQRVGNAELMDFTMF